MRTGEGNGVLVAPDTVRIEHRLPGPAERVWSYLTESEKRRKWLASGDMELWQNGRVDLLFRHRELSSEPTPDRYRRMEDSPVLHGKITECDPPRKLAYTWPSDGGKSEVTFELFAEGRDTLLVLTHRRLADAPTTLSVSAGWDAHLGILVDVLNGETPRGFWSTHARLETLYRERFAP